MSIRGGVKHRHRPVSQSMVEQLLHVGRGDIEVKGGWVGQERVEATGTEGVGLSIVGRENQALVGHIEAGSGGIGAEDGGETKYQTVPLGSLPHVRHVDS